MRCPSAKSLVATFRDLDTKAANLIRRIAKAADDADALEKIIDKECPKTAAYVRSCYNNPYNSQMWRTTVALHAIDILIGGCGVEALGPAQGRSQSPPYEYINVGDTYALTLVYKHATDNLYISSWGNVVEAHPNWE